MDAARERMTGAHAGVAGQAGRADGATEAGSCESRTPHVRWKNRSSTAKLQVVAEAVEQIAVPMIPPKIQPPMKVEKRATPEDEPAAAVATSPSVSDGYVCRIRKNYSVIRPVLSLASATMN